MRKLIGVLMATILAACVCLCVTGCEDNKDEVSFIGTRDSHVGQCAVIQWTTKTDNQIYFDTNHSVKVLTEDGSTYDHWCWNTGVPCSDKAGQHRYEIFFTHGPDENVFIYVDGNKLGMVEAYK